MKYVLILFLMFVTSNVLAIDFKGKEIGVTSPQQIEGCTSSSLYEHHVYAKDYIMTCNVDEKVMGYTFSVYYSFVDDKLQNIFFKTRPHLYSILLEAFKEKYNNLKYSKINENVTTGMGVTHSNETSKWKFVGGEIRLVLYDGNINDTGFTISTDAFFAALLKDRDIKKSKMAKEL